MPDDPPIACTLTADELPQRLAEIRAIGQAGLLSADRDGATAELRFHSDAATHKRLAAIVAAESRCCAFLAFDLRQDADALTLTITGSELAQPAIADLVSAFSDGVRAPRAHRR